MKKTIANITTICLGVLFTLIGCILRTNNAQADDSLVAIQVSPMYQKISLNPGERYYGTFKVTNPGTSQYSFNYVTHTGPFFVDKDNNPIQENNGDYNQIVDWITIENEKGVIAPNNTTIIQFYIDVPENAPAGGQYAAIYVGTDNDADVGEGISLHAKYQVAHLIYGEVAGETIRKGNITDVSVPGFMFKGPIYGTASIKNEGNVHSTAISELRVFPLFSNEELYTNEEANINDKGALIMPGATRTTKSTWPNTPKIGIFHVIYTVSFEGVDSQVDKYVIICPIWLLIVIIALIFLILFKIIFTGKDKKEK